MIDRVLPFHLFESIDRHGVLGTELYTIDIYINRPVKFTVFKLEELDQLNKDLHGLNLIGSQLETDVEDYVSELTWVRHIHRSFYTEPIKLRGVYFFDYFNRPYNDTILKEVFFGISDASKESVKEFFLEVTLHK